MRFILRFAIFHSIFLDFSKQQINLSLIYYINIILQLRSVKKKEKIYKILTFLKLFISTKHDSVIILNF